MYVCVRVETATEMCALKLYLQGHASRIRTNLKLNYR